MLESIRGVIVEVGEHDLTMSVGDLVLRLLAPAFFTRSARPGKAIEVQTYFILQQEGNRLVPLIVAFPTLDDRDFFLRFISVSGVGVRAAVRALIQPSAEVASAIASADLDGLTALPGIGRARARKIVASLQEEMKEQFPTYLTGEAGVDDAPGEAVSVLVQLGIPRSEASSLVRKAMDEIGEEAGSSELVRKAMQSRRSGS